MICHPGRLRAIKCVCTEDRHQDIVGGCNERQNALLWLCCTTVHCSGNQVRVLFQDPKAVHARLPGNLRAYLVAGGPVLLSSQRHLRIETAFTNSVCCPKRAKENDKVKRQATGCGTAKSQQHFIFWWNKCVPRRKMDGPCSS